MGADIQDGHKDTAPWQEHVADGRVEQQTSETNLFHTADSMNRSKNNRSARSGMGLILTGVL